MLCILISSITMASLVGKGQSAPATMAINPTTKTVDQVGITFTLNITIADVTEMWSYIIDLSWNASVLKCLGVTEGPFMKAFGSTVFLTKTPLPGEVPEITCTFLTMIGATGSGVLATVTFNSTAIGTTNLHIGGPLEGQPDVLDKNEIPIDVTVQDGSVTVIPEFPSSVILPLFIIMATIIIIVVKVAWPRRRQAPINIP